MSNSEKSNPVALAVIELHLPEGIGQSVSQTSAENSIKYIYIHIYIYVPLCVGSSKAPPVP